MVKIICFGQLALFELSRTFDKAITSHGRVPGTASEAAPRGGGIRAGHG